MIHLPWLPSLRRAVLGLALAVALVAVASPVRADNPPKFADPEVTAYFQKASDLVDALLKAVQDKDDAKVREFTAEFGDLRKEADTLRSKVTPEEDAAASKWGRAQMEKLEGAGWKPPAR